MTPIPDEGLSFDLVLPSLRPFLGILISETPRRYLYVLTNFERYGVSRPTRDGRRKTVVGLPDTCRTVNMRQLADGTWADMGPVDLTEVWQWAWYNRKFKAVRPEWTKEQLWAAWQSTTKDGRAFTDHVSWSNGYADYVRGVNLGMEPMKLQPIVCGGTILEQAGPLVHIPGAGSVYPFFTMDGRYDPDPDSDYWFPATISRRDGLVTRPDGTFYFQREDIEIQFDQLGGVDVQVPILANGSINYIPADRVREVTPPFPSPYRD